MKIKRFFENTNNGDKVITTTYAISTEESAEQGDYAETGWDDEEGESMVPDEYDIEEGITLIDKAVDYMENTKYTTEPASSSFHKGIYYTSTDPNINYTTGEETYYSCHLEGFTEDEEELIFMKMKDKDNYYKEIENWKGSGVDYETYKNAENFNI